MNRKVGYEVPSDSNINTDTGSFHDQFSSQLHMAAPSMPIMGYSSPEEVLMCRENQIKQDPWKDMIMGTTQFCACDMANPFFGTGPNVISYFGQPSYWAVMPSSDFSCVPPQLPDPSQIQNLERLPVPQKRSKAKKDFGLPMIKAPPTSHDRRGSGKLSEIAQKEPDYIKFKISEDPHYTIPFSGLANEFRKNMKGRKRRCFLEAVDMKDFLLNYVSKEWEVYLEAISERERSIGILNKGQRYVWKQFFKDVQKLFRMIFRQRYHRCDKRKDNNQEPLAKSILKELGFQCPEDSDYLEIFTFFYSVLTKLRKRSSRKSGEEHGKSFTKVFDEDSQENCEEFVNHPLSRDFIIFFIINFGEGYIAQMKGSFKKEVKNVLSYLSSSYMLDVEI